MASYLENAAQIAKEAGELLQGYFERRVTFELKGEYDLVTVADRASEKLIVDRLTALYPTHSILAEEGGGIVTKLPDINGTSTPWTAPPTSRMASRSTTSPSWPGAQR